MSFTSKRNSGIDALRSLSMLFVIFLHLVGQAGLLQAAEPGSIKAAVLSLIQILSVCAVDIYGITTGYFLSEKKFRLSRLVQLWVTTVFWSVAVSCTFFLLVPETRSLKEAVSMFLPVLRGRYWFFTAYFVVMLISPVLNRLILTLPKKTFQMLFLVFFFIFGLIPVCSLGYDVLRISGGNHFTWMTVLYLIGGYLKKYPPEEKRAGHWLTGYFVFALGHFSYSVLVRLVGFPQYSGLMITNCSVPTIGEAVYLFLFFRDIGSRMKGGSLLEKGINWVTPAVYAVYLIHVHPMVYWNQKIIDVFRVWDSWNAFTTTGAIIGTAIAIFLSCVLLERVRLGLFRILRIDKIIKSGSDRLEQTIRKRI